MNNSSSLRARLTELIKSMSEDQFPYGLSIRAEGQHVIVSKGRRPLAKVSKVGDIVYVVINLENKQVEMFNAGNEQDLAKYIMQIAGVRRAPDNKTSYINNMDDINKRQRAEDIINNRQTVKKVWLNARAMIEPLNKEQEAIPRCYASAKAVDALVERIKKHAYKAHHAKDKHELADLMNVLQMITIRGTKASRARLGIKISRLIKEMLSTIHNDYRCSSKTEIPQTVDNFNNVAPGLSLLLMTYEDGLDISFLYRYITDTKDVIFKKRSELPSGDNLSRVIYASPLIETAFNTWLSGIKNKRIRDQIREGICHRAMSEVRYRLGFYQLTAYRILEVLCKVQDTVVPSCARVEVARWRKTLDKRLHDNVNHNNEGALAGRDRISPKQQCLICRKKYAESIKHLLAEADKAKKPSNKTQRQSLKYFKDLNSIDSLIRQIKKNIDSPGKYSTEPEFTTLLGMIRLIVVKGSDAMQSRLQSDIIKMMKGYSRRRPSSKASKQELILNLKWITMASDMFNISLTISSLYNCTSGMGTAILHSYKQIAYFSKNFSEEAEHDLVTKLALDEISDKTDQLIARGYNSPGRDKSDALFAVFKLVYMTLMSLITHCDAIFKKSVAISMNINPLA